MPTIKVIRTWEVTVPQIAVSDIRTKGLDLNDLLYTLTDMANCGDYDEVWCVEYKNEEFEAKGARVWGSYNDTFLGIRGKDFDVLYGPLGSWEATEVKYQIEE